MKRLNIPKIFILLLLLSIIELFIEFGIPEKAKEIGMQA